VTPGGKLSLPANSNAKPSPDGGIALQDASWAPASATRIANTRIRRSYHDSTLLQSPARPGHAARMRQIFEDASREHQTLQHNTDDTLYPQLPNISRKASPQEHSSRQYQHQPLRNSTLCRPESLCMATNSLQIVPQQAQMHRSPVSEDTSESWSDDLGYFVSGSLNQSSTLAVTPQERIAAWLTHVEDGADAGGNENGTRCDCGESPHVGPSEVDDGDDLTSTKSLSEQHMHISQTRTPIEHVPDPFLQDISSSNPFLFPITGQSMPLPPRTNILPDTASTVMIRAHRPCTIQRVVPDQGGIQLSPLSPNVCIERGPARYHSTRRHDHDQTPTKKRSKENAVVRSTCGRGSEEGSPCKVGVGTRFQHPRHHTRFDRGTEF
jgi:hypothetical protein